MERCRPEMIFLLSGQSNMSGRGGVHGKHWDHVIPVECSPEPSILRFTAASKWVEARDPLHADIDVKKICGVGPGMPFATSLLRHLPSTSAKTIGLVPCAIGGTAISEWERGGKLYEQMIARANQSGGPIKAVLWYQGETDTVTQARADGYKANLEKLILDLRSDLGMAELPFIQVALASGVKNELIEQVRVAQLAVRLPNVVCVDAWGLPLNADNLHLTTDSQVILGRMLADAYVQGFLRP